MSRAIEAAALFAVGVVAGGALVYSTRKSVPPAVPPPVTPLSRNVRKGVVVVSETVPEGCFYFLSNEL